MILGDEVGNGPRILDAWLAWCEGNGVAGEGSGRSFDPFYHPTIEIQIGNGIGIDGFCGAI